MLFLVLLLPAARPRAEEGGGFRFQEVTVRPGDTLWSIAHRYLKDPARWNEILRYNKLPDSDPTVALPGMTLRVPVALIKEELRAAVLIETFNHVLYRRKEKADWDPASLRMQLYRSDGLHTLASSRAKVRFVNGEILSLDQNSMAILKPLNEQYDLRLVRGEIRAARARVVTDSARITPKAKDTRYMAKVRDDLSTRVEVYAGLADVEGGGVSVEVKAGYSSEVPLNSSPSLPQKLPKLPEFSAEAGEVGTSGTELPGRGAAPGPASRGNGGLRDISQVESDLESLKLGLGMPISAYHVQVARTPEFQRIVLEKIYDADDTVNLARSSLPRGTYWLRVATVDLLGSEGKFSEPKQYIKR